MHVKKRRRPGFPVARCLLDPGETLVAQPGAMYACSANLTVEAKTEGGALAGLKRAARGGSSLVLTRFTAPSTGGWVDLTHHLPGDVEAVNLVQDCPLQVTRGNWLGCSTEVETHARWAGRNLFGREGGFVLRMEGTGMVFLGCYGALDMHVLRQGERITVASSHIVAYDSSVSLEVRRIAQGRTLLSLKARQFLVCDFVGPGRVLLQTRSPKALAAFLQDVLPRPTQPPPLEDDE